jgi:hypothetical protein
MEEQRDKAIEQKLIKEGRFKSGANWFFWIAALSLVNSVILLLGKNWGFVIGLGITQFIDAIGSKLAEEIGPLSKAVALLADLVAAGVFVLFGVLARKRQVWAFLVGMVLYALDGLLFILVADWLSVAFHAFALWGIYGGLKAMKGLSASPPATEATH